MAVEKSPGLGAARLAGAWFFLITLAPFTGFLTGSYMRFTWVMDHVLYIPLIGLVGLPVAGIGPFYQSLSGFIRPYAIWAASMAMILLAWQGHRYAGMYLNEETLWNYTVQHNPEAYVAHNNLGKALVEKNRTAEAIEHFEQALRLNPDYAEAHNNLSAALLKEGRSAEAMEQYKQALLLNPDYADAHYSLGTVLLGEGQTAQAIEQYQQALRIKPDYDDARNELEKLQAGLKTPQKNTPPAGKAP